MHITVGKRVLLLLPTLRFSASHVPFISNEYICWLHIMPLSDAHSELTDVMKIDCPYLKYCNLIYNSKREMTFQNQIISRCTIQLIYFRLTLHTSTLSVDFTSLFASNFFLCLFNVVFLV
jgi:hypothetical protein